MGLRKSTSNRSLPLLKPTLSTFVYRIYNKLFHEFTFNLSRKSREINYLTISGYYPDNRLAKIQISGHIRYPDSKKYLLPN